MTARDKQTLWQALVRPPNMMWKWCTRRKAGRWLGWLLEAPPNEVIIGELGWMTLHARQARLRLPGDLLLGQSAGNAQSPLGETCTTTTVSVYLSGLAIGACTVLQ